MRQKFYPTSYAEGKRRYAFGMILVSVLSIVNLFLLKADLVFAFALQFPMIFPAVFTAHFPSLALYGYLIGILLVLPFIVFSILSFRYVWPWVGMLVLTVLDTVLLLMFFDFAGYVFHVAFHLWMLVDLGIGLYYAIGEKKVLRNAASADDDAAHL